MLIYTGPHYFFYVIESPFFSFPIFSHIPCLFPYSLAFSEKWLKITCVENLASNTSLVLISNINAYLHAQQKGNLKMLYPL